MQNYVIETTLGTIGLEIDDVKAPLHAANFAKYVADKHYDGLIFHRVIPGFMIQGGGHDANLGERRATHGKVKNESLNGLLNNRGTVAAARLSDPDTASCQFYINLKDNDFLDGNAASRKPGYSVFGRVTSGMDVVDKIAAVKTGNKNGYSDVPLESVTIKTIRAA